MKVETCHPVYILFNVYEINCYVIDWHICVFYTLKLSSIVTTTWSTFKPAFWHYSQTKLCRTQCYPGNYWNHLTMRNRNLFCDVTHKPSSAVTMQIIWPRQAWCDSFNHTYGGFTTFFPFQFVLKTPFQDIHFYKEAQSRRCWLDDIPHSVQLAALDGCHSHHDCAGVNSVCSQTAMCWSHCRRIPTLWDIPCSVRRHNLFLLSR